MRREEEAIRLFIAIDFDDAVKGVLRRAQTRLLARASGIPAACGNLHLTLVFLGEVPPERVGVIETVMDGIQAPPLSLTLGKMGFFRQDGGFLWWMGVEDGLREPGTAEAGRGGTLQALHTELYTGLAPTFPLESRRFVPHVTLARQVRPAPDFDAAALAREAERCSFREDSIVLLHSQRLGGRLTYAPLFRKQLERG